MIGMMGNHQIPCLLQTSRATSVAADVLRHAPMKQSHVEAALLSIKRCARTHRGSLYYTFSLDNNAAVADTERNAGKGSAGAYGYTDDEHLARKMNDANDRLENINLEKSFVDVDNVIDAIMSQWFAAHRDQEDELQKLFKSADDNGDGVLSMQEFSSLVQRIDTACNARTVRRMFRACGDENMNGDIPMKPHDFARIIRHALMR